MANSGVICDDAIIEAYKEQKLRHTCKYILCKISDDKKQIVMESTGDADWQDFAAMLPEKECRYAIYDFGYELDGPKSKLVFVAWSPDVAKVPTKMLYASSKDALKKKLEGIAVAFEAHDSGDLAYTEIYEKVSKSKAT